MSDILEQVWKQQPKGYYSVSSKYGDVWNDKFFKTIEEAKNWLDSQSGCDLYFCITTLSKPRRIKENVNSSCFLWQDLDEVDPRKLEKFNLKPTIAWESSPGRYQALWKLDKVCDPDIVEKINKSLCKVVGADQSSWILTKVLRIPGTLNYKYDTTPEVKLLWSTNDYYKTDELGRLLADSRSEADDEDEIPAANLKDKNIPPKVRHLLRAKKVEIGSRSETLWYIEHELMKSGFDVEQVYNLVKDSAWNKYKGRRDEHQRLLHEISEAFKDEVKKVKIKPAEEEKKYKLQVESDIDFMQDISSYPGWLVEGFWTRKSHGIIAGEPKSFKSTLALDLALSIASGRKFLNEFEVVERGPVIIIQNENAPWIMKDRLEKIRSNKGLIGIVEKNKKKYQITFPDLLPIYYLNQQGFSLSVEEHRELLDSIAEKIKPKLIILDPLYLMFDGDINSAKDLSPILSWLLLLKEKHDTSLIVIHHWRKSQGNTTRGGQRILGSVTLHGWLESAWYINAKNQQDEEGTMIDSEFNTPSATTTVSLEREFRGAGIYPKIDLKIKIGEFGESIYDVQISKHKRSRAKVDKNILSDDILNFLSLQDGYISRNVIGDELGISRKTVGEELKKLLTENKIQSSGKGWKLKED